MAIQKWLIFLFLHLHLPALLLAQPDLRYLTCRGSGNYSQNSPYHSNLNTLLSSVSSNIDKYGFYNASTGQNSDRVSVIALCRGDVGLDTCRGCVNNATQKLVQGCPNRKEAFGGYDECMLQYSDGSIVGSTSNSPIFYLWNVRNATRPKEFNQKLRSLLYSLRGSAANDNSIRKYYASGNVTGPYFQTIYALVQCTPDLSSDECSNCLSEAYGDMPNCPCNGKSGGRIVGPKCNFRYESYPFFKEAP